MINFGLVYYKPDRDAIVSFRSEGNYRAIKTILKKYGANAGCSSCNNSDADLDAEIQTAIDEGKL